MFLAIKYTKRVKANVVALIIPLYKVLHNLGKHAEAISDHRTAEINYKISTIEERPNTAWHDVKKCPPGKV